MTAMRGMFMRRIRMSRECSENSWARYPDHASDGGNVPLDMVAA